MHKIKQVKHELLEGMKRLCSDSKDEETAITARPVAAVDLAITRQRTLLNWIGVWRLNRLAEFYLFIESLVSSADLPPTSSPAAPTRPAILSRLNDIFIDITSTATVAKGSLSKLHGRVRKMVDMMWKDKGAKLFQQQLLAVNVGLGFCLVHQLVFESTVRADTMLFRSAFGKIGMMRWRKGDLVLPPTGLVRKTMKL